MESIMPKYLALALLGTALVAGPAMAQSNQTTNAPGGSGQFITQEKPDQWRMSQLKGLNVYNPNNEKIGDINELLVDSSGRIEGVVIGVGGFLGMGEHDVAIPFSQVRFVNEPRNTATASANRGASNSAAATDPDAPLTTGSTTANRPPAGDTTRGAADARRSYPDHAVVNMNRDQLKAAPEFKSAR
jgi:sporulation protein YlmC with PRC-barrel domain